MKIPAVIKNKFENMKYRHKLTILLVTASLVPMILLVLYSHDRMSSLLREKKWRYMSSILEQTGEGIDSQIEVFSSLLNYLTYSPDIEDLITEKNMDNYQAYRKYTEVADPLLSVPKSYHDAIIQIQLFAESIKVRHEYTLVPLSEVDKEWWYDKLAEDVSVQLGGGQPDTGDCSCKADLYRQKSRQQFFALHWIIIRFFSPLKRLFLQNPGA